MRLALFFLGLLFLGWLCWDLQAQFVTLYPVKVLAGWDEATHIADGMRLARLLGHGQVLAFMRRLYTQMNYWPPGMPSLSMPAFWLFGYESQVARTFTTYIFFAASLLIYACAFLASKARYVGPGLISASLFLLSPLNQTFANIAMLEIPGTFGLGLCLLCYFWYLSRPGQEWALHATCFAVALLFFIKFNYAIFFMAPFYGQFFYRSRRKWLNLTTEYFAKSDFRLWSVRLLLTYTALLFFVLLTGGFKFRLFDQLVTFEHIFGTPLFFGCLLVLYILLRHKRRFLRAVWQSLSREERIALYWCLPMLLWLANPLNFDGFFNLVVNMPLNANLSLKEKLLFYPNIFLESYAQGRMIGVILCLGVALNLALNLAFFKRNDAFTRFVAAAAFFAMVALTLHHNKLDRHLIPAGPLIILAAVAPLIRLQDVLPLRGAWLSEVLLIALALTLVLPEGRARRDLIEKAMGAEEISEWQSLSEVLDKLCGVARQRPSPLILGVWNDLSAGLITTHCLSKFNDMEVQDLPVAVSEYHFERALGNWPRLLEERGAKALIFVDYTGQGYKSFMAENVWNRDFPELALKEPRLHLRERAVIGSFTLLLYDFVG